MLKTNSKKAKENTKAFIASEFSVDNYGLDKNDFKEFKDIANFIYKCFKSEYLHGYNLTRNNQETFIDWLWGMPSVLSLDFLVRTSAIDILKNILEETEQEANKYTEQQAEKYLLYLITRRILNEV